MISCDFNVSFNYSTDAELDKILSECFSEDVPIRSIFYKGLFVPDSYPIIADAVENFEVRDDDVWVCSFPKTGIFIILI